MASKIFCNVCETSVQDTSWSARIFLQLPLCVVRVVKLVSGVDMLIIGALVVETEFTCVIVQFHGIKALLRHKSPSLAVTGICFILFIERSYDDFFVYIQVKEFKYSSNFQIYCVFISHSHNIFIYCPHFSQSIFIYLSI